MVLKCFHYNPVKESGWRFRQSGCDLLCLAQITACFGEFSVTTSLTSVFKVCVNAGRDAKGGKGVQYLNRPDRWLGTQLTIKGKQEGVLKRRRISCRIMQRSRNDR